MDRILITACLITVLLQRIRSFNINVQSPVTFQNPDASFGQSVLQFRSDSGPCVVISAPLEKDSSTEAGKLYKCTYSGSNCVNLSIPGSGDGLPRSFFGLSLAANMENLIGCGTVPQQCSSFTYNRGICYTLDNGFRSIPNGKIPEKQPDCSKGTDIVFLIDGSGSVGSGDFERMKIFVKEMVKRFTSNDIMFALAQYSSGFEVHFDFNKYAASRNVEELMRNIRQERQLTHTPTAIRKVTREVFTSGMGSRQNANRILVVITDGETYGDNLPLSEVAAEADRSKIIRYAIGVGSAFSRDSAQQELRTIASKPSDQHVFRVENFNALDNIQNSLQDKIFAIEGLSSQSESSFQFEMAQTGFSAAFSQDSLLLGAVGAYDWSGGFYEYRQGTETAFVNISSSDTGRSGAADMRDSYLGYSVAIIQQSNRFSYVAGAPRYQHKGMVAIFSTAVSTTIRIYGEQIGSYFGAEVCSVDLNGDKNTDLLLIGAPMYQGPTTGGMVQVHLFLGSVRELKKLQGLPGQMFGQFGSSIAELGDINGDKIHDVAIGAPLEDNQQGRVYIFHGERSGIKSTYSQWIEGKRMSSGLMYFGRALSGGMDLSQDGLPDIAVGAQGKAFILRSQPILGVTTRITFIPPQIPLIDFDCSVLESYNKFKLSASVCFEATKVTADNLDPFSVKLNYSILLDPLRQNRRAVFDTNKNSKTRTMKVEVQNPLCENFDIKLLDCVKDTLAPIELKLEYSLISEALPSTNGLSPVLRNDVPTHYTAELPFMRNCGEDKVCKDELKVSFNFSELSFLTVGVNSIINLTISVQNDGEDSYESLVNFFYPSGLSYRKVTLLSPEKRMFINCDATVGSEEDVMRNSTCRINHPIFKAGSRAVFLATFDVSAEAPWGQKLNMSANVTSDNQDQQSPESVYSAALPIKFGVNVLIKGIEEESVRYVNFSDKTQEQKKLVRHVYQVENLGRRSLEAIATFLIPVRLGTAPVWRVTELTQEKPQNVQCKETEETTGSGRITETTNQQPTLDCTVATCKKIQCYFQPLQNNTMLQFVVEGELVYGWIPETKQKKLSLLSSATISYSSSMYSHIFPQSERFLKTSVVTSVEVYEEYNYLPIVIGSSVGGLVLLAVITAVLYKVGFFKRQYKEKLTEENQMSQESNMAAPPTEGST
uniref:Integrin alpha-M-like n=1 Tax=Geotrypetes seraphini TaxID=260995 RepID=A0A6P8PF44_GEOSA|nr:integrin alpha-M-like [Geotrypetes seraphini]